MRRTFIGMLIMSAFAGGVIAAPITPEEALNRVSKNNSMRVSSNNLKNAKLVHTVATETGVSSLYVFNRGVNQGYMILSADDTAYPLLGYSDSGSFDSENMPPQMEWWLDEYSRFMEYAISNGAEVAKFQTPATLGDAISPLLKTRWDQNTPYNNECPKVGSTKCPTGCVATALAQVMKYWNYPESGSGTVNITLPSGGTGDRFVNLSVKKFDWGNMLDSYAGSYTETGSKDRSDPALSPGVAARNRSPRYRAYRSHNSSYP